VATISPSSTLPARSCTGAPVLCESAQVSDELRPLRSYTWVCASDGHLTPAERASVRAAIRRGYVDIAKSLARWPLNRTWRRAHPTAATALQPPDSKLARSAEEAAAEQGLALVGHGYRTWLLGGALSAIDGVRVDAELLYVASLLHDSGLVRQVIGEDFTRRSADTLIDVFARAAQPAARGLAAADAVVAHTTPGACGHRRAGRFLRAGRRDGRPRRLAHVGSAARPAS